MLRSQAGPGDVTLTGTLQLKRPVHALCFPGGAGEGASPAVAVCCDHELHLLHPPKAA